MATIPNRYYNSPWIADAARNLASALYGDPEREARQEQMRYERSRQERMDQIAIADHERKLAGQQLLGDIVAPGLDDAAVQAAMQAAITGGVDPTQAMTAAGTVSPKYRASQALQDDKQAAALQQMQYKIASQEAMFGDRLGLLYAQLAQEGRLGDQRNATTQRGQDMSSADRRYVADTGAQSREKAAQIRANAGGKDKINRRDAFLISADIDQRAASMGVKLDPYQKAQIQAIAEREGVPVSEAMAAVMQGGEVVPGESHLFGADDPATLQLPAPITFADVFAPRGAPAPAAITATPQPPASALKEGVRTKFANGQVWTLRNGQPMQVQ